MTRDPQQPDPPPAPPMLASPLPAPRGPVPLPYRGPGAEPKSQWITDDDPRHGWFMALLVAVYPIAAVCGFIGSLVWVLRMVVGC
jgi:hypothetical protein